ncbi:MAG: hypothetical protein RL557_754 [archaeon]|jgi:hypothetical protein
MNLDDLVGKELLLRGETFCSYGSIQRESNEGYHFVSSEYLVTLSLSEIEAINSSTFKATVNSGDVYFPFTRVFLHGAR